MADMPITSAVYGKRNDDKTPEARLREHLASLHPRRIRRRVLREDPPRRG